jgi:hypothetical protein
MVILRSWDDPERYLLVQRRNIVPWKSKTQSMKGRWGIERMKNISSSQFPSF